MEAIVHENVDREELKKLEKVYHQQLGRGKPSEKAQFEYAWCLVRSEYHSDIKNGIALLEDLFRRTSDEIARRDYLFYSAIGSCRLKDYPTASKLTKAILQVQPRNGQALELQQYIEKQLKKDGLMGMAIVGGTALAVGGVLGLVLGLVKKGPK